MIKAYHDNQSDVSHGLDGRTQDISSATRLFQQTHSKETDECCQLRNVFKKRRKLDIVGGGKCKSSSKSSVLPINNNLDKSTTINESLKRLYETTSKVDKPLEPLSAGSLQSTALTLNVSMNQSRVEFRNGNELQSTSNDDNNLKKSSSSKDHEAEMDTMLTDSIANILFKQEPNKDHVRNNSTSVERNSLSMTVSCPNNTTDDLRTDACHDNPSFENTTPVRGIGTLESNDKSFITKL